MVTMGEKWKKPFLLCVTAQSVVLCNSSQGRVQSFLFHPPFHCPWGPGPFFHECLCGSQGILTASPGVQQGPVGLYQDHELNW
jgi:hypothetical protein